MNGSGCFDSPSPETHLPTCGTIWISSTDIPDKTDATLALLASSTIPGLGSGLANMVEDSGLAGPRGREKETRLLGIGVRSNRPLASSPRPLPEMVLGCCIDVLDCDDTVDVTLRTLWLLSRCGRVGRVGAVGEVISITDIEDKVDAMLVVLLLMLRLGIGSGQLGGLRCIMGGESSDELVAGDLVAAWRADEERVGVVFGTGVLFSREPSGACPLLFLASTPLPLRSGVWNSFLRGSHVLPFFLNASCHWTFLAVQAAASCAVACSWNSQRFKRQLGVCSRSLGKMPFVNWYSSKSCKN